ncbi:MAG: Holliday junction branch migration protein RuvA [Alphaproteobacteria bacterium]|nr:Holliday junction branch migration protein RuvA [Alphaproteobacteria bacterium]
MIAKLKGIIDTIGEDYCIVDVNGVGYLVFASSKTLSRLFKGEGATLLIETIVRDDSISLFVFADAWEKEWFSTLTKVQGVGAKVCLSILSVLTPVQLAQAISAQDKSSFTRASGVGPKLAARIVTELKDKIVTIPIVDSIKDMEMSTNITPNEEAESYATSVAALNATENPMMTEDAISALINLGYQRLEAYKAVNKAALENPNADTSALIKAALKEFARKDI